jgi:hypothetical protein
VTGVRPVGHELLACLQVGDDGLGEAAAAFAPHVGGRLLGVEMPAPEVAEQRAKDGAEHQEGRCPFSPERAVE